MSAESGNLSKQFGVSSTGIKEGIANNEVYSSTLQSIDSATSTVELTPWVQMAEISMRNDGKLEASDWASAVGGTLTAAVTDYGPGVSRNSDLNLAKRMTVNMLVGGALSGVDKEAGQKYLMDSVGNEVGQFVGGKVTDSLDRVVADYKQRRSDRAIERAVEDNYQADAWDSDPENYEADAWDYDPENVGWDYGSTGVMPDDDYEDQASGAWNKPPHATMADRADEYYSNLRAASYESELVYSEPVYNEGEIIDDHDEGGAFILSGSDLEGFLAAPIWQSIHPLVNTIADAMDVERYTNFGVFPDDYEPLDSLHWALDEFGIDANDHAMRAFLVVKEGGSPESVKRDVLDHLGLGFEVELDHNQDLNQVFHQYFDGVSAGSIVDISVFWQMAVGATYLRAASQERFLGILWSEVYYDRGKVPIASNMVGNIALHGLVISDDLAPPTLRSESAFLLALEVADMASLLYSGATIAGRGLALKGFNINRSGIASAAKRAVNSDFLQSIRPSNLKHWRFDLSPNQLNMGLPLKYTAPNRGIANATEAATTTSARLRYMGKTPDKYSRTGREVIERMRGDGLIQGEGPLLRGNPNNLHMVNPDGTTTFIDSSVDMAHRIDAVTWWNDVGRFHGPKSPEVRQFMLNSDNYVLQPSSINRSAGARLGQTYQPPVAPDFSILKR